MRKAIMYLSAFAALILLTDTSCLVKNLIGIPCPGCGMTRAYLRLLHFDISGAFFMHPLFLLPPAFPFIFLIKDRRLKAIVLYSLISVYIGAYIYRMLVYFPHTQPMDFNKSCLILKLFK